MKRKTFVSTAFFLLLLFLSTPVFSCESTPISQITEFEKVIIANSTGENLADVLRDALCFSVSPKGFLKIEYSDGLVRYMSSSHIPQPRTEVLDQEQDPQSVQTFVAELGGIADNFFETWNTVDYPDDMGPEMLQKADELASQYLRLASQDPWAARDVGSFAGRGNRYMSADRGIGLSPAVMDLIPFLNKFDVFRVLSNYLDSSLARTEDKPTDDEKVYVIRQLKDYIHPDFHPDYMRTIKEIQWLDPALYQELSAGMEE